ncbi:MAG: M6 family metalloprotease domain-containing protein [Planctomycetota bacterium]|jgi:M6 family metalloprotease-like protein
MIKYNKYQLVWYLFILLFIMVSSTRIALAVPAYDGAIVLTQPSGYYFEARQKGDEWYNWIETKDGYGICINQNTGNCEYLVPSGEEAPNGSPISSNAFSGAVVGKVDPDVLGIPKGVRPPRRAFHGTHTSNTTLDSQNGTTSMTGDLSQSPISGTKYLLVIGVDYANQPSNYTVAQVQSQFFGASGSVADYFSDVSYSNVSVSPATESHGTSNDGFVGWVRLSGNHPNTGSTTGIANQQIARDAILAADTFINYSQYDTDSNGIIETTELSIIIIVAGYERAYSASYSPSVWGHKWSMWSVGYPSVDGKTIQDYAQFGERHRSNTQNDHLATIGIMAHELGHLMFSLPDLYDTDSSNGASNGIGSFGLMGSGSWAAASGSDAGSSPTHPCAWSKESLAWGTVTPISLNQLVSFPKADGNNDSIFRINSSDTNQYFLIENRQFSGYDIGFQRYTGSSGHGGIVIYHIDTLKTSLYYSGLNKVNADENDKGVDVEEANQGSLGYSMLDTNTSRAHTNMFYFAGNNSSFTNSTIPDSKLKDGTATNIPITNISAYGDIMTATTMIQPNAPSNVSASDGTYTNMIQITWTDSSNNEDGFRIYRSTAQSGIYTQIGTANTDYTSYDDILSCGGTPYWYLVTAYNIGGESGNSNTDSGYTDSCSVCTDNDGDGYGVGVDCLGPDCDDNDPNVYPGATEVCDGVDNNCNGQIDEGFDVDGDGFTSCNGDCDDGNAAVNPAATEVLYNGIDDDCNPATPDTLDADGDGYTSDVDCDDGNASVNPGATEVCDGVDNNCNGQIDEGFDVDGDGFTSCNGDCDDGNAAVNPAATEVLYNGIDDDCNPATPDTTGLVGHWTFDEGSGQTIGDSSGNNLNGTLGASSSSELSDPTWGVGISGGALSFDGVDDHARIVSSALLDNLSQGTIEVMINPGSDGGYHIMIKRSDVGCGGQWRGFKF